MSKPYHVLSFAFLQSGQQENDQFEYENLMLTIDNFPQHPHYCLCHTFVH